MGVSTGAAVSQKTRDFGGVTLGVGGRETTAEVSRASDKTGAKRRGVRRKPKRLDGGDSVGDARVRARR